MELLGGAEQACWMVQVYEEEIPVTCSGERGLCCGGHDLEEECVQRSVVGVHRSRQGALEQARTEVELRVAKIEKAQKMAWGPADADQEVEIRATPAGFSWELREEPNFPLDCLTEKVRADVEIRGPPVRGEENLCAFLMGMHPRLGAGSAMLPLAGSDVVRMIISSFFAPEELYIVQSTVIKEYVTDDEYEHGNDLVYYCSARMPEGCLHTRRDDGYYTSMESAVEKAESVIERLVKVHGDSPDTVSMTFESLSEKIKARTDRRGPSFEPRRWNYRQHQYTEITWTPSAIVPSATIGSNLVALMRIRVRVTTTPFGGVSGPS